MKRNLFSFLLLSFAVAGCLALGFKAGNGKVVADDRNVKNFQAVQASGASHVTIKEGEAYSCVVRLDSNLQKDYLSIVDDGVLRLGFRAGTYVSHLTKLEVDITMPRISKLVGSGASTFNLKDSFKGKELKLELSGASILSGSMSYSIVGIEASGASRLDLKGDFGDIALRLSGASHLKIGGEALGLSGDASGASKIEGAGCDLQDVDLELSGASKASLGKVASEIKARLSGASHMDYDGSPAVTKDLSGASSLNRR
jgi:hypothetical protein